MCDVLVAAAVTVPPPGMAVKGLAGVHWSVKVEVPFGSCPSSKVKLKSPETLDWVCVPEAPPVKVTVWATAPAGSVRNQTLALWGSVASTSSRNDVHRMEISVNDGLEGDPCGVAGRAANRAQAVGECFDSRAVVWVLHLHQMCPRRAILPISCSGVAEAVVGRGAEGSPGGVRIGGDQRIDLVRGLPGALPDEYGGHHAHTLIRVAVLVAELQNGDGGRSGPWSGVTAGPVGLCVGPGAFVVIELPAASSRVAAARTAAWIALGTGRTGAEEGEAEEGETHQEDGLC